MRSWTASRRRLPWDSVLLLVLVAVLAGPAAAQLSSDPWQYSVPPVTYTEFAPLDYMWPQYGAATFSSPLDLSMAQLPDPLPGTVTWTPLPLPPRPVELRSQLQQPYSFTSVPSPLNLSSTRLRWPDSGSPASQYPVGLMPPSSGSLWASTPSLDVGALESRLSRELAYERLGTVPRMAGDVMATELPSFAVASPWQAACLAGRSAVPGLMQDWLANASMWRPYGAYCAAVWQVADLAVTFSELGGVAAGKVLPEDSFVLRAWAPHLVMAYQELGAGMPPASFEQTWPLESHFSDHFVRGDLYGTRQVVRYTESTAPGYLGSYGFDPYTDRVFTRITESYVQTLVTQPLSTQAVVPASSWSQLVSPASSWSQLVAPAPSWSQIVPPAPSWGQLLPNSWTMPMVPPLHTGW
jgi:hypothetical protein